MGAVWFCEIIIVLVRRLENKCWSPAMKLGVYMYVWVCVGFGEN